MKSNFLERSGAIALLIIFILVIGMQPAKADTAAEIDREVDAAVAGDRHEHIEGGTDHVPGVALGEVPAEARSIGVPRGRPAEEVHRCRDGLVAHVELGHGADGGGGEVDVVEPGTSHGDQPRALFRQRQKHLGIELVVHKCADRREPVGQSARLRSEAVNRVSAQMRRLTPVLGKKTISGWTLTRVANQ